MCNFKSLQKYEKAETCRQIPQKLASRLELVLLYTTHDKTDFQKQNNHLLRFLLEIYAI